MKKLFVLLVAMTLLVVSGCATGTGSSKVKCPSCGYEFEVPRTR